MITLPRLLQEIFGREKASSIWDSDCLERNRLTVNPEFKLNIFSFDSWLMHNYLEYLNNSHKLSMKDFLATITTQEQLEELEKYLI